MGSEGSVKGCGNAGNEGSEIYGCAGSESDGYEKMGHLV